MFSRARHQLHLFVGLALLHVFPRLDWLLVSRVWIGYLFSRVWIGSCIPASGLVTCFPASGPVTCSPRCYMFSRVWTGNMFPALHRLLTVFPRFTGYVSLRLFRNQFFLHFASVASFVLVWCSVLLSFLVVIDLFRYLRALS